MDVIITEGLTKYYGTTRGIEDLSLSVEQGEIFGFLGPNGAGKSTTIHLLLDLLRPTRGRALIFGQDVRRDGLRVRQRIGVVPGELRLYEHMSGAGFLDYLARFQDKLPILRPELLRLLDLSETDLRRPIRGYSRGMKQKLGIIQGLQHDPELLILDEPTEGLDPLVQHAFYRLIAKARDRGCTIFMSSHILFEVERVCDRVGIVRAGRLVALERVEMLARRKRRQMQIELAGPVSQDAFALPGVSVASWNGSRVSLWVQREGLRPLLQRLAALPIVDIVFEPARLEEAFLDFYRETSADER